ncbi:MAG: hypothetical protein WCC14_21930, partial [Acidobacteriaceae bacterium]
SKREELRKVHPHSSAAPARFTPQQAGRTAQSPPHSRAAARFTPQQAGETAQSPPPLQRSTG